MMFKTVDLDQMRARFVSDMIAEEIEPGTPISAEQRAAFERRAGERVATWLAEKRDRALEIIAAHERGAAGTASAGDLDMLRRFIGRAET